MAKNMSSYVSYEKLLETIGVLKKCDDYQKNEKNIKKSLNDSTEKVILQIDFKKIPLNSMTFIQSIDLPYHWRHETDIETCLIVNDINKEPLTDREMDLEMSKSHYRDLLKKFNVNDDLITRIMTLRELRTEYIISEAKNKLSDAYDVFLADKNLMNNKFKFLPRFLGKRFWIKSKKVPSLIDLEAADLNNELQKKLNKTFLYVTGNGSSSSVTIGHLNQSDDHLVANLSVVINKLKQLFGENVRSLRVKTEKSMGIVFYLDCGFISHIRIERAMNKPQPIVDDFSHFINSNIAVYADGDVQIIHNDDGDDEEDDDNDKDYGQNSKRRKKENIRKNTKVKSKIAND